ncbi:hypothetical protein VV11_013990 [Trichodesmium erythraeum 21-75]|nr:hypothetical protein [Trichodesmium erythraeum 21-75]
MAKHAGVARHAYNWGLWLTRNILTHNSKYRQVLLEMAAL